MTDIVDKLRHIGRIQSSDPGMYKATHLTAGDALEAAAEIERLRSALANIDNELVQAMTDDCENGVAWLNVQSAEKYLHDYRYTKQAIEKSINIARAALEGK